MNFNISQIKLTYKKTFAQDPIKVNCLGAFQTWGPSGIVLNIFDIGPTGFLDMVQTISNIEEWQVSAIDE